MPDRLLPRRLNAASPWLCLAIFWLVSPLATVAVGQQIESPRMIHYNLRRFEIPFSIDTTGQRPAEVQLYVSRDAGAHWQLFGSQSVTETKFLFEADEDGDYWFATRTVDSTGNPFPAGRVRPQLAVRIDTAPPQAELTAEVTADDEVSVSLTWDDHSSSAKPVRFEYSVDQTGSWQAVPDVAMAVPDEAERGEGASAKFAPPAGWRQISLRAIVADQAGNKTLVTYQIDRPRVATNSMRLAANQTPVQFPSSSLPAPSSSLTGPSPKPVPSSGQFGTANQFGTAAPMVESGAANSAPITATPWAIPQFAVASGLAPPRQSPAGSSGPELTAPLPPSAVPELPPSAPATDETSGNRNGAARSDAAPQPRPRSAAEAMRPLVPDATPGERQGGAENPTPLPSTDSQAAPSRALSPAGIDTAGVPVRHSRSRQFSLEYEVESAGLAGVDAIELWGTTDRGETWKRWGSDPDRESPFDIETNHDGLYGFRIVVVARNGLATPRPLDGDPADMFVVIDTERPRVRITGANYGEGQHTGSLVISYECRDENLAKRPITLAFGPSTDGPWSTIAAGLENDGIYVWPADPQLPRQIYLRIDATDLAGNVGSYVLDAPIDVQGLAPRARIRGFNPLTGSPGGKPWNPPLSLPQRPDGLPTDPPAQTAERPSESPAVKVR